MLFDDAKYQALVKRLRESPEARSLNEFDGDMLWREKAGNFGYVRFAPGDGPYYPEVKFDLDAGVYSTRFCDYMTRSFDLSEFEFPADELESPLLFFPPDRNLVPSIGLDRYWSFERRRRYDIFQLFTRYLEVDDLFEEVYACFLDLLGKMESTLSDREICDHLIRSRSTAGLLTFFGMIQLVVILQLNGWTDEAEQHFRELGELHGGSEAYVNHLPHLSAIGLPASIH